MHAEIEVASKRIAHYVRTTPVMYLEPDAWGIQAHIVLKLEQLQHTGSFKPRGAFNRILTNEVPEAGVIAASGGNHGIAVAYAAQHLGYRSEIFVPEVCSPVKVERLRSYGAQVSLVGATYADQIPFNKTSNNPSRTRSLVWHRSSSQVTSTPTGVTSLDCLALRLFLLPHSSDHAKSL